MVNYEQFILDRLRKKDSPFSTKDKLLSVQEYIKFIEAAHKLGKSVILTEGTWDLTHVEHVLHNQAAQNFADIVLLRLASSEYVEMFKGVGRPIEVHRELVVCEFECVDAVLVDDTAIDPANIPQNAKFLADLHIDMLALEPEDENYQLKLNALNFANNNMNSVIKPVIMQLEQFNSTTAIINKIQSLSSI